jgi:hypothetical protein
VEVFVSTLDFYPLRYRFSEKDYETAPGLETNRIENQRVLPLFRSAFEIGPVVGADAVAEQQRRKQQERLLPVRLQGPEKVVRPSELAFKVSPS